MPQKEQSSYIRLIHGLIIVGLILPVRVQSVKFDGPVEYQKGWEVTSEENTLRADFAIVERLKTEYQISQAQQKIKKTNYGRYQCVAWAKKLTGVYGTWGDGGRRLTLNGTGQIGEVVIFKSIHVAVVIGRVGQNLVISEANFDLHGSIRTRQISIYDRSIRGYHSF
jgi:hypothetical protein